MNIDNARTNLPLKKLIFTEYGEFRKDETGEKNWFKSWRLRFEICRKGDRPEDFEKFERRRDLYFRNEESALATAVLFTGGYDDWDIVWAHDDQSELGCPPHTALKLIEFTVTEYVYGRDTGCEWSDPENDIRKKARVQHWVRQGWKGNVVEFSAGASRLSPWAVCEAYRNSVRVMESTFPSEEEQKRIVGFEWNDRVYGNPRFRKDDPSVLGDPIDGRTLTPLPFPGDGRELGDRADVNFLHDYMFWHYRDQIYIVGGNFYMNGELLFNVDNLVYEAVPNIHMMSTHDIYMLKSSICENSFFHCEEVLDWLHRHYPDAEYINGDHGNYSMRLVDDGKDRVGRID